MKRILFLFAASLLLLACSNDDGNQPTEEQNTALKIQEFSRTVYVENGDVFRIDLLFDEAGKVTNRIEDYFNNGATFNDSYTYNNLDQVIKIQLRYEQEDSLRRTLNYGYDETSHTLQNIKWLDFDGSLRNTIDYTYQGNLVNAEDDFGEKTYTFNGSGKLIKTVAAGGDIPYQVTTENINYSNDIVTSLNYENSLGTSENYAIEYDDKTNPLYKSFTENTENYIYGFVGNMKNFKYNFSPNNYTSVEYTNSNDPSYNYTETKTTQFNENGYPISAIVKRNDILIEELTYEYY